LNDENGQNYPEDFSFLIRFVAAEACGRRRSRGRRKFCGRESSEKRRGCGMEA
jgi:hypothetical protein